MTMMEWKNTYSVGVPALDADHQRLIDIINRLDPTAADGTPVDWILQELTDYVRFHFRREEFRMADAGYPGLDRHLKEHAAFRDWLETLRETVRTSPTPRATIARSVGSYLESWLADHILKTDMDYRDYLA